MDVFLKYPASHFSHLALPVAAPYPGGHVGLHVPEHPVPFGSSWNSVKGSVQADWLALQINVVFPATRELRNVLPACRSWRLPGLASRSLRRPVAPKV